MSVLSSFSISYRGTEDGASKEIGLSDFSMNEGTSFRAPGISLQSANEVMMSNSIIEGGINKVYGTGSSTTPKNETSGGAMEFSKAPQIPRTSTSIGKSDHSKEQLEDSFNYNRGGINSLILTQPSFAMFRCFAGYMKKMCPSMPFIWQTRYFVLKQDGSIYYYVSEQQYKDGFVPRGVIHINDIRPFPVGTDGVTLHMNQINICVRSKNNRTYRLWVSTEFEARNWESAIRSHMSSGGTSVDYPGYI
jgi:hypothetical protein